MAEAFKNFKLALGTSSATAYTCPAATKAIVLLLQVSNVDGVNEADATAPLAGVKASSTVALIDDTETSMGALTATAGLAGPHGDIVLSGLLSSFEANSEDVLSVTATESAEGYPIAFIKLANETASNNSAAAILTALKALVPTGTDYDGYISAMTLTADATWTASPPITTPALLDFTTALPTNGEDPIPAPVTQEGNVISQHSPAGKM